MRYAWENDVEVDHDDDGNPPPPPNRAQRRAAAQKQKARQRRGQRAYDRQRKQGEKKSDEG